MKIKQHGFGTIEVLLLLLVIAVIGFGGYYVWHTQHDSTNKTAAKQAPASTSSTGGPASGHVVATNIDLVTGLYIPANVDIKKGETVTWEIKDGGAIPQYAIASDSGSSEAFSSNVLKTGDKFSHTFNEVGTFGWHDKYYGNLTGSVTVTE